MAFQVCSGRSEVSRRARPTAAVSRDSLSSLPPPVPAPARRSPSRSDTATPNTDHGISAAAAYEQSLRIRRQPNLILQNPGIYSKMES